MASAATYTKTGNKASKQATLPKGVFDTDTSNHDLIAQVYEVQQSNKRVNSAKTKDRSQVRGGGRKPWRQKGLGYARAGTIRSPLWRGGGITFGPEGRENYSKKLNKSATRKALAQALSLKADNSSVSIIEDINPTNGKTKELQQLLDKLSLEGKILIVAKEIDPLLKRASANIPHVRLISAEYLNTKAVVDADQLLFTKTALEAIGERLGGKQ